MERSNLKKKGMRGEGLKETYIQKEEETYLIDNMIIEQGFLNDNLLWKGGSVRRNSVRPSDIFRSP